MHAKVCVMDNVWAAIDSPRARRFWLTEARLYAHTRPLQLAREHLDTSSGHGLTQLRRSRASEASARCTA